jgi:predicted DNA-binding protein
VSSVENLGRWLYSRGSRDTRSTANMQIRLDLTSDRHLTELAKVFGMPKATLAQELLRAAIQDVRQLRHPYVTAGDMLDPEELEERGLTGDEIMIGEEGKPVAFEEIFPPGQVRLAPKTVRISKSEDTLGEGGGQEDSEVSEGT